MILGSRKGEMMAEESNGVAGGYQHYILAEKKKRDSAHETRPAGAWTSYYSALKSRILTRFCSWSLKCYKGYLGFGAGLLV